VDVLEEKLVLGIDIGGTKTALALVDCKGVMSKKILVPSEAASMDLLDIIVKKSKALIATCGSDNKVIGIGVGFPGVISTTDDKIVYAPNLKDWEGLDFKGRLENLIQLPVFIENDCNSAVIGESLYGAGKGIKDFTYLTISTGIGGGIISGGNLLKGNNGFGGEVGHMILKFDGPQCTCGRKGCLEALASGTAIAKKMKESICKGKESLVLDLVKKVEDITAKEVFAAASQNDSLAVNILDEASTWIAIGINNIIMTINPQRIAVGGSVAVNNKWFLDEIRNKVEKLLFDKRLDLEIVSAGLDKYSGLVGAAAVGWIGLGKQ